MTCCRRLLFICTTTLPNGPHRVDHVACRQVVAARNLRVAGRAAAKRSTFNQQVRSGRPVDRAVDTTAPKQPTFSDNVLLSYWMLPDCSLPF